jgi:hypothetical protein
MGAVSKTKHEDSASMGKRKDLAISTSVSGSDAEIYQAIHDTLAVARTKVHAAINSTMVEAY